MGLHGDHRPLQGCDQVGRRIDLLDRAREPGDRLPGRPGGGGDRHSASQMGRAPAPGRGEEARRRADPSHVLAFLSGKCAKWWLPDDVVFVDEIPHTATGKILKTALRDQFKDYTLPTAVAAAE